jgi:hypothetical protein
MSRQIGSTRPDMREADMKCRRAACLFPSFGAKVASIAASTQTTRSRKLTAEDAFCCEFNHPNSSGYAYVLQV